MKNEKERHIVIMAGGIGSRFWPMSTAEYPKQFIDVMGVGKSLLQLTIERFQPICPVHHCWIVTSEKYVETVKQQLPDFPDDNILLEPEARNTAPCIAYACWKIKQHSPQANIVVTPSDAFVLDPIEFRRIISEALDFTETHQAIVTVGIKPNRPETGYGYICATETTGPSPLVKVEAFKEKPNRETAQQYLDAGNYFWNAGIFVWNMDTILTALRTYTPGIASLMDEMSSDFYTEKESATVKRLFPTCEKISIDYAVMEKSKDIYTIPADFGWSDLGTWGSLHGLLPRDEQQNAVVGEHVKMYDCQHCIVHVNGMRQVVLEGLDGYIVSERDGRLLICRLQDEQRIKEFSAD